MPNEVYQVDLHNNYGWRKTRSRFHFRLDLTIPTGFWVLSREIFSSLADFSSWFFWYTQMITYRSYFTKATVRRVWPTTTPRRTFPFQIGEIPGGWGEDVTDNFTCAGLNWVHDLSPAQRCANRIGPLGGGTRDAGAWYPIFLLTVDSFVVEHISPHSLFSGNTIYSCSFNGSSDFQDLRAGRLMVPVARQENRRLRF